MLAGRSMAAGAATVRTPGLRYWRTTRALLQAELARRAGVNLSSVSRGESGWPLRLNIVRALAEALEVQPADLMRPAPAEGQELRHVAEEPDPHDPEPPT